MNKDSNVFRPHTLTKLITPSLIAELQILLCLTADSTSREHKPGLAHAVCCSWLTVEPCAVWW